MGRNVVHTCILFIFVGTASAMFDRENSMAYPSLFGGGGESQNLRTYNSNDQPDNTNMYGTAMASHPHQHNQGSSEYRFAA